MSTQGSYAYFASLSPQELMFYGLVVYGSLTPSSPVMPPRKSMDELSREARAKGRPLALHICNGDTP